MIQMSSLLWNKVVVKIRNTKFFAKYNTAQVSSNCQKTPIGISSAILRYISALQTAPRVLWSSDPNYVTISFSKEIWKKKWDCWILKQKNKYQSELSV